MVVLAFRYPKQGLESSLTMYDFLGPSCRPADTQQSLKQVGFYGSRCVEQVFRLLFSCTA